jgi:hypothetical protein
MMSNAEHQFSLSAPFLRRYLAFACAALLFMGSSAKADTVLAFSQENPSDFVSAISSGGTTTLSTAGNADGNGTSVPVSVSIYNNMQQVPFPSLFYEYIAPGAVTSTGTATSSGGAVSQTYAGTIQFYALPFGSAGNTLLLQATFTDYTFSGVGTSGGLNPGAGSTTVFSGDPGYAWTGASFSLSFTSISPGLSVSGGTINSFHAVGSGTFSATVVPEPGTLSLSCIGIGVCALTLWKKRSSRSKG